jgi:hypothetical protein
MLLSKANLLPTDPDAFLEARRMEEANRLRLLAERDAYRNMAWIEFAALCTMAALWILREVAR